jgi:hypothetical protein
MEAAGLDPTSFEDTVGGTAGLDLTSCRPAGSCLAHVVGETAGLDRHGLILGYVAIETAGLDPTSLEHTVGETAGLDLTSCRVVECPAWTATAAPRGPFCDVPLRNAERGPGGADLSEHLVVQVGVGAVHVLRRVGHCRVAPPISSLLPVKPQSRTFTWEAE